MNPGGRQRRTAIRRRAQLALVIHDQRDLRVPVTHGIELLQALLVKGVPTRLVSLPDENLQVLKPQNSLSWYSEIKHRLDQYNPPPPALARPRG